MLPIRRCRSPWLPRHSAPTLPYFAAVIGRATTTNLRQQWRITPTDTGVAFDVTFSIGFPQCERGGVASSPALPAAGSPAASARQADQTRITDLAIGQAFTLLVQGAVNASGSAGVGLVPGGLGPVGDFNNSSYLSLGAAGAVDAICLSGGIDYGPGQHILPPIGRIGWSSGKCRLKREPPAHRDGPPARFRRCSRADLINGRIVCGIFRFRRSSHRISLSLNAPDLR